MKVYFARVLILSLFACLCIVSIKAFAQKQDIYCLQSRLDNEVRSRLGWSISACKWRGSYEKINGIIYNLHDTEDNN